MRIRTIKPEFWRNEDLARLPEFTRLLAIALLNYADDEGYFPATPALIRGELFPFHEDSVRIQGALTELSNIHFVDLYSGINGRLYGKVVTFEQHQKINRPTPSKIKELINFSEGSLSHQGVLTLGTGNREQGKGTGNREDRADESAPTGEPDELNLGDEAKLKKSETQTDDEWLSELSDDPAYRGIDVPIERAKCARWCREHKKQFSRRRFINWLNRCERPMQGGSRALMR